MKKINIRKRKINKTTKRKKEKEKNE